MALAGSLTRSPRERMLSVDFPLLRAEDVARAILLAAGSVESGQVWVVQPPVGSVADPTYIDPAPGGGYVIQEPVRPRLYQPEN